ncbi:hypothetical protein [Sphingomonas sp. DT-207]|uniref:aromatic-ring hydroxylase C-terminal domain-containing protein n=1 Tax=Sphingomonas sp. DT-207 TaxID=3396167 RepID=UPI003F54058F
MAQEVLGLSTRLLAGHGKQGAMRRGRDTHQLDIGYRRSSLSHNATGRATGPLAGDRMPDALLTGAAGQPRRLFDLFAGPHWTLLVSKPSYLPGSAAYDGVRIVTIGIDAELRDTEDQLGMLEGDALLIRPDGYVGATFRGAPRSGRLSRESSSLRECSGRQGAALSVARGPHTLHLC